MQSHIESLGGQSADEYATMKTIITAKCPEGHICRTNFDNIIHKNRIPCRVCRTIKVANSVRKWSEENVKSFIESKGGSLVSKFSRVDRPITMQCSNNHTPWTTTFDSIHRGSWCPHCAHNRPICLNDIAKHGKQKGFTLLSKTYIRCSDKLKWRCSDGHIFYKCWNTIRCGQCCPICYIGTNESKCRFIFEQSFKVPFPQTRKVLGNHYQLDGYNDDLKIAFEYQGEQHYKPAWYHKKNMSSFHKLQKIDQEKIKLCLSKGIICIEIPHWEAKNDEQLKIFIRNEFKRLGIIPKIDPMCVNMNKFPGRPSKLEEIRTILKKAGSELLSGRYVGMKEKTLKIKCKCGHIQPSAPQTVLYADRNGQGWCYLCRNKKISGKRKAYWQRQGRYDYDKIKQMYSAGNMTMKEVGKEFKCSLTTVHKAIHFGE